MKKALFALAISAAASAHAGDLYMGLGLPIYTIGYAQTVNDAFGVRGEYAGWRALESDTVEDGIIYKTRLKYQTVGVFGDWHPTRGGFRVVGGLTVNDTKINLNSTGGGGTANINGKTVNLTQETFNVELTYPRVTPYVGIGYGFSPANTPGFAFYVDAGLQLGRFKTEATTSLVGKQGITQADVDAETSQLRDSTAKLSALPKLSIGVSYRF
jgi:hypothetical protein